MKTRFSSRCRRPAGRRALLVFPLALLGVLPVFASSAAAQAIGGTVRDATGGVLPGVTVEARSPALIEQVRVAVTDGNGQYLIVALEAGTYSVSFQLPGFTSLVREGVQLRSAFTANLDAELTLGQLTETVTVTDAPPMIDIRRVSYSDVIDQEIFEALPTTRGYDSLALLIPAINVQGGPSTAVPIDTGGVAGVPNNRLTVHGSDEYDAQIHLDGYDVSSVAFDGAPAALPQDTAVIEYVYEYSANPAEVETGGVLLNMIPKEGSNALSAAMYGNYGHGSWLASNVDDDLVARGITGGRAGGFRADQSWQLAPAFGGPVFTDRLWAFASHTYRRASFYPSGLFDSSDAAALLYVPDLDSPTLETSNNRETTVRLTWQATSIDKVQSYYASAKLQQWPALTGSQLFPLYIAPEAGSDGETSFDTYQLTWLRTQTDRLLFEVGYSRLPGRTALYPLNDTLGSPGRGAALGARTDLPGLFEATTLTMSRNMGYLFDGSTVHFSTQNQTARGALTYVTGSHNLKVGARLSRKSQHAAYRSGSDWTNAVTVFGLPVQARFSSRPPEVNELVNLGVYAQDQWTVDRVTVTAGLRFDYFNGGYPDHLSAAGADTHSLWAPAVISVPGATAAAWKDLQPRVGVVYDLRGDGRTALKASVSRYGSRDAISLAGQVNPIANNVQMNRLWFDGAAAHPAVPLPFAAPSCIPSAVDPMGLGCVAGDSIPQGDPLNPMPNGELLGPSDNPAFGTPLRTAAFDPAWAFGWGTKKSNWELVGGVQHELLPNVSLDLAYFRRHYVNLHGWDNRAVSVADFDEYVLQAPIDQRLPGGGGYDLTLVDMRPDAFGRLQDNWQTGSGSLGGESESWQGVDVSVNARLEAWLLHAGLATGRRIADYCGYQAESPEVLYGEYTVYPASRVGRGATGQLEGIAGSRGTAAPREFCRADEAWLTNLSASGSYSLPHDIDVSAAFFSRPGPRREAIWEAPLVEVERALGRRPTLDRVALNILRPGTVFGDRLNQLDVRVARPFSVPDYGELRVSLDFYNLFNSNAVSREQQAFGRGMYLAPIGLQPGRLFKVSFQYTF